MQKKITILGSTGSIGTQALEVCRSFPDRFRVTGLTASDNHEMLILQAMEFQPGRVVIANAEKYQVVKEALAGYPIEVHAGDDAIAAAAGPQDHDMVLVSIVGFAGLRPTLEALNAGKDLAIANKETFVVAGEIVNRLAREKGCSVIPVDSEHSAIFQCLTGEKTTEVEKLILTASGGPFRGMDHATLSRVTREQALRHPNWEMGAKITIDSASLMNKGLEVIEAHWLFGIPASQIDVVVHPQSVIHSMVQFTDGSIKAQMGLPDMRLPIQYALSYPERLPSPWPRFDFARYPALTFESPDTQTFRNLPLAFEALRRGGNMPCILNAANEVAVAAFLKNRISFTGMSDLIEKALHHISFVAKPRYQDYIATDQETRKYAESLT
ncbi:MAG TPA: 1-deoxy-D-xylulose-5-phosphate reductoisomerase [Bacteroidales bacterium]|nr:1-deoxy-D-xylulose-5-phosphate reductoisomerase [Bacteroidales bacterium]HRZ48414.1 1-deoxy-D-xylulose-5-phosphate reductoisomerase [Bacteroidales bacterium]